MWLKRREDVEWLDLGKLELPFFAKQWVESNLNVNDFGIPAVRGLDKVIWDDFDHTRHVWDQHAYERLLTRVESAEVFLVHSQGSDPFIPLLQRGKEEKNNPWKIDKSLSHEQHFNVEWMLSYAVRTKGLWAPLIQPEQKVARKETTKKGPEPLTVSNPRWEHVDQKRGEDSPDATMAGDKVTLMVDVTGAADRTPVTFKIFDNSLSPPGRVGVTRGKVDGGVGSAEWQVKVPREGAKLEFEGEVRRVVSERVEIPVKNVAEYFFSF